MAGLWETLPASPCSSASDDPKHQPSKPHALLNTLPPAATTSHPPHVPSSSSPPVSKRARIDLSPRSTTTRSVSFDVDRRDPAVAKPGTPADTDPKPVQAPASPADDDLNERRRALMERLRIIQSNKAKLVSSSSPPPSSVNSPEPEVTLVQEKIVTAITTTTAVSTSKRRAASSTGQSRRPSGKKASKQAPKKAQQSQSSSGDVIDLEAASFDVSSLAPKKPAGNSTKRKLSARDSSNAPTNAIDLDLLELSKRKSSRVRRPRAPNDLDDKLDKVGPIPTCMSKCKRVQFCKKLLMSMLKDENAKPFSAPVKELWHEQAIPKYFDIITVPMDLRTVKKNLDSSKFLRPVTGDALPYRFDVEHFADDVRLVFRNAMVYNRAGDLLYNSARELLASFESSLEHIPPLASAEQVARSAPKKKPSLSRAQEKMAKEAPKARSRKPAEPARSSGSSKTKKARASQSNYEDVTDADLEGMSVKELRDRLRYLARCRVPVMARVPVPKGAGYLSKAALLYEVEMSWQERKKCMEFISRVPQSKMESLVEMVKKSSAPESSDAADEGEFELDFDNLDNKTGRNIEAFLEQFVPGFKTVRSSTIGREFPDVGVIDHEMERIRKRLSEMQSQSKKQTAQSGGGTAPSATASKSFFNAEDAQGSSSSDSGTDSDSSDDSSSDDDSGDDSD